MLKYSGPLGRFSYSEDSYRLSVDADEKQYLEYIGTETDGHKIKIPDGIVDATGMFQDKAITSQPVIPESVEIADCMFAGCDNLTETGEFPASLRHADYMYSCCPSLESVHALPEGLQSAQGMFDGCSALIEAPRIPSGLQNKSYMFFNCDKLAGNLSLPGVGEQEYDAGFVIEDDFEDLPDSKDEPAVRLGDMFERAEASTTRPAYTQSADTLTNEQRMAMLDSIEVAGLAAEVPQFDV